MRRFERTEQPECLVEQGARWTENWLRKNSIRRPFVWPQFRGQKLNHLLMPQMKAMTNGHCSYCDAFPVQGVSLETIDHFRPKSVFAHDAFLWENLYYCCSACQQEKQERFDEQLLRPDDSDFEFTRYFHFNARTGVLAPSPMATALERTCAEVTIELLGLNRLGRPEGRLRLLRTYSQNLQAGQPMEELPYRYILSHLA